MARGPLALLETEFGPLYVSPLIPRSEHPFVLACFEQHARAGFGSRVTTGGYGLSEFESDRGTLVLSTDRAQRESFAFYDWET